MLILTNFNRKLVPLCFYKSLIKILFIRILLYHMIIVGLLSLKIYYISLILFSQTKDENIKQLLRLTAYTS